MNIFTDLGNYLDDGPQSIVTGKKQIIANGNTLQYGPTVNFTKTKSADRVAFDFHDPMPKSQVPLIFGAVTWATISRLEIMANGQTFAVGTAFGQTERREIKISVGEPT